MPGPDGRLTGAPGDERRPGELGFVARYTMGTPGCGPVTRGPNYPRVTNITFVCDTTAGVGQWAKQGTKIENPPCNYNFVWRSLYACPLCTEAMYSYFYSPCIAGSRQKVYYWLDAPLMCNDGILLYHFSFPFLFDFLLPHHVHRVTSILLASLVRGRR